MSYADRATSAPLRQTGWLTPTNWLAHRNKLFCAGIQPRTGTTSWFLGQGGACEEATSPRAVTSTQPSSHHRSAVYRQLPAAGRAEHPADAPWALAPCFLHPTPLMGGNSLRASPVEFSANPGADLGQQGGIPERGPPRPSYPQGPLSHAGGNAGILCYRTRIELGLAMSSPVSGNFALHAEHLM